MFRACRITKFGCCQHHLLFPATLEGAQGASKDITTFDRCYDIKSTSVRFGVGAIDELGRECRRLRMSRVLVLTDRHVSSLEFFSAAVEAIRGSGVDAIVCSDVAVEPTDVSFAACGDVLRESRADGVVSVGGGSVMDTAKAASVWAVREPGDELLDFFSLPLGRNKQPPRSLVPHIACPTTCGTGSECTAIAVCDVVSKHRKAGMMHKAMTPTMAIVDPAACYSLPRSVLAASGFDVLSHAIESYTARSHTQRLQLFPADKSKPVLRPSTGGRNPFSDIGCLAALEYVGRSYLKAVSDSSDVSAINDMVFASTVAGTAMGSAGCHIPHGMSYPVSGNVPATYRPPFPYPGGDGSCEFPKCDGVPPVLPHGFAVALHTPAVCRMLQSHGDVECHNRMRRILEALGVSDIRKEEAGYYLADLLISYLKQNNMPRGLSHVGFTDLEIAALAAKCQERRLLGNAPFEVELEHLQHMYKDAAAYW